ncbi:MAG: sugar phosphate isomerase/epimerase family protein [Zavarzinella sp.]
MFLGYNTNGFAHHRLEDAIEILAEQGYRGVALTVDYQHLNILESGWNEYAQTIKQLLDRHQMQLVIETGARFLLDPRRKHQPTLLDSAPSQRQIRQEFLQRCVQLAQILGAECISFWSGALPKDTHPDLAWERLTNEIHTLLQISEQTRVRLAFEPEPGMLISRMADFEVLHDLINHELFGLTLDCSHLTCEGDLPASDHIRKWLQHKKLWNIHLADMNAGIHDHLMFGEGAVDFADIFHALQEGNYSEGAFVELSRHSHQAVQIASDSMAFLRTFVSATA